MFWSRPHTRHQGNVTPIDSTGRQVTVSLDEADALMESRHADEQAALDHHDQVVSWLNALAREFASTAPARRKPAPVQGVNHSVWLVPVGRDMGLYIAVYPNGSWSWLSHNTSEGTGTTYQAVAPATVRGSLANPHRQDQRGSTQLDWASYFRRTDSHHLTEPYVRESLETALM